MISFTSPCHHALDNTVNRHYLRLNTLTLLTLLPTGMQPLGWENSPSVYIPEMKQTFYLSFCYEKITKILTDLSKNIINFEKGNDRFSKTLQVPALSKMQLFGNFL